MTNCTYCGRALVAVGHARSNGKCHSDWGGRHLHKKCFKELTDDGNWDDEFQYWVFNFGKHKGQTAIFVSQHFPQYFEWVVKNVKWCRKLAGMVKIPTMNPTDEKYNEERYDELMLSGWDD
jgi:hypothetical protein